PGGAVQAANRSEIPAIEWTGVPAFEAARQGIPFNVSLTTDSADTSPTTPVALVTVPVSDLSGKLTGVLAAPVDLRKLPFFSAGQRFDLGETGTVDVVDGHGHVLASTDPSRLLTTQEHDSVVNKLFVAGKPGVENCLGCSNDPLSEFSDEVVAFAPLSEAPWGVVIRQKASEVFALVRRLMLVTVILALVTVLGALFLVWMTTNSVIKPVQALTAAAQRITAGDLDTPITHLSSHQYTRDELGILAQSFVGMRKQLKRSMNEIQGLNQTLDTRVRERTQAALDAQLEAQAARDDLRAIIDALDDELVVVDLKRNEVQLANRIAQDHHVEHGNLIGMPYFQAFPCMDPDTNGDCQNPIPEVLQTNKVVRSIHYHPANGSSDQRILDIVASPMRASSGEVTRVVELLRDVTEEHSMRQALLRRNQQLAILNAISTTVNKSLNLEELLNHTLVEVLRLTQVDVGAVFLLEAVLGKLELAACQGLSPEAARLASEMGMLDSSCGGIMDRGEVIVVPDIRSYRGKRARSLKKEHLSSLMHIPLMSKGFTLGSLCLGTRKPIEFTKEEEELLKAIGSQIAVAVENARLYAEVQQKEQIRGELFNKAINAQEDERKRIARELHDETSQTLTAMLFTLDDAAECSDLNEVRQRLSHLRGLSEHTLDGVHKLIFDLRPSMLDHLGLVPALRGYAEACLVNQGVRVVVDETSAPRRLESGVETAIFRVVQEALNNIARHAAARNVWIQLNYNHQCLTVTVEDDGIGFEPSSVQISPSGHPGKGNQRGLGLMGMRERLELLGGTLEITSLPGQGTELVITVPLMEKSVEHV
ncbi:MAG TPA: GAF domain-containing protein, partial [Anaerolineales bacterium]|nr:GAF domain-containing protein [Anaerolineales bacterium]